MTTTTPTSSSDHPLLPKKDIPGSYGIPFFSPIRDRLAYFYSKGQPAFLQSKIDLYSSTVFRTNLPPGPFIASDHRAIAVLDATSFPILFNTSKLSKKDVLTGTFIPSPNLTGGYRVGPYLDPSEPSHPIIKQFIFTFLASRKDHLLPAFLSAYAEPIFTDIESQLVSTAKAEFNKPNDSLAFVFLSAAFFNSRASGLHEHANKWLYILLAPLASNVITRYIPWFIEDLLLRTFPLPAIIAKPAYKKLYAYFESAGASALDAAEGIGLSREEACHNLLFATCFNTYGGLKLLFPCIVKWVAAAGGELHGKLAAEVRAAVAERGEKGKVTVAALEKMELVRSVVYEVLRIEPPVPFQYGRAKEDFVLESHDALFQVRKGELIFGYQPFATKDPRVFGPTAEKFVPDRFVGDEGAKLLRYLLWSNGPETEKPTVDNKQCAGKNFVLLVARLFVAELFLRYDTFTVEVSKLLLGANITFTSIIKATAATAGIND